MPWHRTVTDEGSPPLAGLTAALTFAILRLAAAAASAPSEGFGFRAPPVADTARKASRCRPQVRERIAEARAENGEGAKLSSLSAFEGLTEGERTRGCCLHKGVGVHKMIQVSLLLSARLYLLLSHTLGVSLPPSFLPLKWQKATSLLRGRRGGYRRKATDSPPCAAPLSTLTTARCPLPTDFHYF